MTIVDLSAYASLVDLDLAVRLSPAGPAVRDVAHLRLLARFGSPISAAFSWAVEVPMPLRADLRGFDAMIGLGRFRAGIDAETRLRDVQAVARRLLLKKRDSGVHRVLLVVADTRANRAALREAGDVLSPSFRMDSVATVRALADGKDPGADGIVLV